MNDDQLKRLLGKARQTGTWEEDLLEFGKRVAVEVKRLRTIEDRRLMCLDNGGHHFQFLTHSPVGEWVIENGKTTISGWRGCDITCRDCDAWLTVTYEEKTS